MCLCFLTSIFAAVWGPSSLRRQPRTRSVRLVSYWTRAARRERQQLDTDGRQRRSGQQCAAARHAGPHRGEGGADQPGQPPAGRQVTTSGADSALK